jgi:phage terminase large subunit
VILPPPPYQELFDRSKAIGTLRIPTARVLLPLLRKSRYKGAHGGRGSGKSHFFAQLLVERCIAEPGMRAVCIREVQNTLAQSSKQTIEYWIRELKVGSLFDVTREHIKTPGGGLIIFQGMQDHSSESIKSLEGFKIAWVDEAQSLSERSLSLLRPTIRAPDSEIWFSWNPTRDNDAVDKFLRGPEAVADASMIVVQVNWRDNPFWTDELEAERQTELARYPERYPHTYEGEYAGAFEGAYFAKLLTEAKLKKRIGVVTPDPLLPVRAFHDIGGSSAKADAYAIWIVQWVEDRILVLDYYESVGQVLAHHTNWMRSNGYEDAINYLPHDGARPDGTERKSYEDHWREAGFKVEPPIKNQGTGAAPLRIEAVRRLGPKLWFNEETTRKGRLTLGFYHEKRDSRRNIGLGPDHDWSSHCADAFGLMAICYKEPRSSANFNRRIVYENQGYV